MRLATTAFLLLALIAFPVAARQASDVVAPEANGPTTAPDGHQAGTAKSFMVVAAHPLAAEAGRSM